LYDVKTVLVLRVRPRERRPREGRGMIEQDFAFHVISAANKLRK
jgi:hypothetical protein